MGTEGMQTPNSAWQGRGRAHFINASSELSVHLGMWQRLSVKSCAKVCLKSLSKTAPEMHHQDVCNAEWPEQQIFSQVRVIWFIWHPWQWIFAKNLCWSYENIRQKSNWPSETLNSEVSLAFPMLIEYNEILDEIPNAEEALHHPHKCTALEIPALEPAAYVLLLFGRGHSQCS